MAKRILVLVMLLGALSLVLGSCGEKKAKDPYALVTLRQATRGKVVSKGFRYKFEKPNIVALNNHLGVVREGNLLEFISGRSLEDKLAGFKGKDIFLGVVKEFSPFVHFRVEKVFTPTDTIFLSQVGSITYPHVYEAENFDASDFEEYDLDRIPYNRTAIIKKLVGRKFLAKTTILTEEEDGKNVFMLVTKKNKFRVAEPEDGTAVILKMLVGGNYLFEGGITFTDVENWPSRRVTHIIGTVSVDFVKYGRTVVSG